MLQRERRIGERERESVAVLSGGELDGGRRATVWVSPQYNYIYCINYKYVVYFLRVCFLHNTTVIPAQNRTWITQKPVLMGKSFYSSED
jgi:hypothetical protein